jgi:hypothetical protein
MAIRWPWQHPSAPAPTTTAPIALTASADPRWPGLPPIQRTTGEIALTAPLESFTSSLTTARAPIFASPMPPVFDGNGILMLAGAHTEPARPPRGRSITPSTGRAPVVQRRAVGNSGLARSSPGENTEPRLSPVVRPMTLAEQPDGDRVLPSIEEPTNEPDLVIDTPPEYSAPLRNLAPTATSDGLPAGVPAGSRAQWAAAAPPSAPAARGAVTAQRSEIRQISARSAPPSAGLQHSGNTRQLQRSASGSEPAASAPQTPRPTPDPPASVSPDSPAPRSPDSPDFGEPTVPVNEDFLPTQRSSAPGEIRRPVTLPQVVPTGPDPSVHSRPATAVSQPSLTAGYRAPQVSRSISADAPTTHPSVEPIHPVESAVPEGTVDGVQIVIPPVGHLTPGPVSVDDTPSSTAPGPPISAGGRASPGPSDPPSGLPSPIGPAAVQRTEAPKPPVTASGTPRVEAGSGSNTPAVPTVPVGPSVGPSEPPPQRHDETPTVVARSIVAKPGPQPPTSPHPALGSARTASPQPDHGAPFVGTGEPVVQRWSDASAAAAYPAAPNAPSPASITAAVLPVDTPNRPTVVARVATWQSPSPTLDASAPDRPPPAAFAAPTGIDETARPPTPLRRLRAEADHPDDEPGLHRARVLEPTPDPPPPSLGFRPNSDLPSRPVGGPFIGRPIPSLPTISASDPVCAQRSLEPAPDIGGSAVGSSSRPFEPTRTMSLRRMFEHAEWSTGHDQGTAGVESAPAVQRESPPAPDAPVAPAVTAPAAATIATTAGAAPAVGGAAGSTNLDELATQLYEPLVARLKAELWLDRERAGALIDPRR